MPLVSTLCVQGIYQIIVENPPVNAMSGAVRQHMQAALADAATKDDAYAIVIRCAGQTFFAGADITEFGKPPIEPNVPDLIEFIAAMDKPVVAAMHGAALGGGCELALACHYRIAVPSALLGLPEVKLGFLPAAGGTQRLARAVGAELALEMTAKGERLSALRALEAGLIDRMAGEYSLAADAVAFAAEIASVRPIPRLSDRSVDASPEVFAKFRSANAKRFSGFDAPEANIRCIEVASERSFSEGLAFERESFIKLFQGTQSAALRHLFFAERQAAKIEGLAPDTPVRTINRVGIVGAGTMGSGIAMSFLSAGIAVTMLDVDQESIARGTAAIRSNYETSAAKGRLSTAEVEAAMRLLTPSVDLNALGSADLIIEAVYEDMAVKQQLFARLDRIAKPDAILATNTSFLDVNGIAAATNRPGDVVGLHFFSPANVMKMMEVVRGAATSDEVLATAMRLAKKIGKIAVVAGVCDGFIGNRMLKPRQAAAGQMLLEGATPEQIDRVHLEFGMPMGPFQMVDLAGLDIGWHRDPHRIETIRDALCANGRWGQKTGKGFYDYDGQRRATPSAEVQSIIHEFAARSGMRPREISDQEIVERTLYPIVDEGMRILEEGMAQRASDIDVMWVHGYGWPSYRGGPMFWAEREGFENILRGMERHGLPASERLRDHAALASVG